MGYFVGNVEADAIDMPLFCPVPAPLEEIVHDLRIVGVQFRHHGSEGEGEETAVGGTAPLGGQRPLIDEEPVPVGRFGAFFHHILPRGELGAAVVEYRVQHHPDAV